MATLPEARDPVGTPELVGGRYELLERIGHGGMSTIYRARDTSLGRLVAVKVIRHDPAVHGDLQHLRERFRREAANAARIPPHPNVVQIYDYGTDAEGDRDFIVMELLEGRDLKTLLRERRFSTPEAVRIIQQAASGLAAGHRAGIVHRDVKPANLVLAEEGGEARLLDFGIAKALEEDPDDDLTRIGGMPYTPAYASPEQRQAGPTLSPASDVYQLGLVAYELLTGERAFDGPDRERIARGETPELETRESWLQLPAALRAVVERALQPDPADRHPDAGAFAAELAAAWEDDHTLLAPANEMATLASAPPAAPSEIGPISAAPAAARAPRRTPSALAIGLFGFVVLLLLWTALPNRSGGEPEEQTVELPSPAELEEIFAPLYRDAAEWVADQADAATP